jgi:hypothetical protein
VFVAFVSLKDLTIILIEGLLYRVVSTKSDLKMGIVASDPGNLGGSYRLGHMVEGLLLAGIY